MAERSSSLRKLLCALVLPLFLVACGGAEKVWAPDADVQRAIEVNRGPTQVTLVTVISNRNGSGAHSGLIIDASQKVIFDPAGSFKHPAMPERNDVLYGLTDQRREVYLDYHARVTYHVVTQTVPVSPQIAETILRKVEAYGAVPKAYCANSVSTILKDVPGFTSLRTTFYPVNLQNQFAQLPGVVTRTIYDDDADDNRYVVYQRPDAALAE